MASSLEDDEERRAGATNDPIQRHANLSPVSPKPVSTARSASLDGETIFAVGEDADKWSENESPRNSGEGRGLVNPKTRTD